MTDELRDVLANVIAAPTDAAAPPNRIAQALADKIVRGLEQAGYSIRPHITWDVPGHPAAGLLATLDAVTRLAESEQVHVAMAVTRWLADHLDALTEWPDPPLSTARDAIAELRAAGGHS